ncbi:hypothetical protein GCM10010145_29840 [Streptomyces ruber]|uniref:Uncharacterized protein n=2 Tax=Streptomyces TaxID=1883 RepID=A0A918BBL1_9ACTN|nr:hypothetical protein GCM10010145_29840 [Streptomyces ruber]
MSPAAEAGAAGDGFGDEAMKVLPGVRRLSALRLPSEGARGQGSPERRDPVRGVHGTDVPRRARDMRFTPTTALVARGRGQVRSREIPNLPAFTAARMRRRTLAAP